MRGSFDIIVTCILPCTTTIKYGLNKSTAEGINLNQEQRLSSTFVSAYKYECQTKLDLEASGLYLIHVEVAGHVRVKCITISPAANSKKYIFNLSCLINLYI